MGLLIVLIYLVGITCTFVVTYMGPHGDPIALARFSPLIVFCNHPSLDLAICGHHRYQQNFLYIIFIPFFMSQLFIKHFTAPLFRWNTVYHSIQFCLTASGGIINSPACFGVIAILPVGNFISIPPHFMKI